MSGGLAANTGAGTKGLSGIELDSDVLGLIIAESDLVPVLTYTRNLADALTTHVGNDATNTKNVVFFAAALNIKKVLILPINSVGANPYQSDEAMLYTVNAADAATAKALLEDATGSSEASVDYIPALYGRTNKYSQSEPITRVDVLPLNDTSRVIIIGIRGV